MPELKHYKQTEFSYVQELCEAMQYTGDNIEQIRKVFPSVVITQDATNHIEAVSHNVYAKPGDYIVKRWEKETGKVRFFSPLSGDFEKHYREIQAEELPTLKRYYKQTERNWAREECEAIQYTGDNIEQIKEVFPTCLIQTGRDSDDITVMPANQVGETVSAFVRPGDYIVRIRFKDNEKEDFISPIPQSFKQYYKEIKASDIWDSVGTTLPEPQQPITVCCEDGGGEVRAMRYTGNNAAAITALFPDIKAYCENKMFFGYFTHISDQPRVNGNRYTYKKEGENARIERGDWVVYDHDHDNILVPGDNWDMYTTTLPQLTGKSADAIIIDYAITWRDELNVFARKYTIDTDLCRQVVDKSVNHYSSINSVVLDGLTKALKDYDMPINTDTFVKLNFLLDQWVKNHGDSVMPIGHLFKNNSTVLLLKEMILYRGETLRSRFKEIMLSSEGEKHIDCFPDYLIDKCCKDAGVYQVEYGIIKFNGEI